MRRAGCWIGLVLVFVSAACRQDNPAPSPNKELAELEQQAAAVAQTPAAAIAADVAEPLNEQAAMPVIQSVQIVRAYRPEGLQSQELQFDTAEFRQRPSTGVAVTLVPLGINLPAVQSRVLNAEKTPDPCSDSLPPWWEVQLAPLKQTEFVQAVSPYREAEDAEHYPFRVCVVFPAVPQAQALNPGLLDLTALPAGTRLEHVLLALDLNGDQTPDLLLLEVCCDNPETPLKECDLTCRKTWLRTGGQWKLIDSGTPC
jgi:hypothetical protein